jgi:hypothetical protein
MRFLRVSLPWVLESRLQYCTTGVCNNSSTVRGFPANRRGQKHSPKAAFNRSLPVIPCLPPLYSSEPLGTKSCRGTRQSNLETSCRRSFRVFTCEPYELVQKPTSDKLSGHHVSLRLIAGPPDPKIHQSYPGMLDREEGSAPCFIAGFSPFTLHPIFNALYRSPPLAEQLT